MRAAGGSVGNAARPCDSQRGRARVAPRERKGQERAIQQGNCDGPIERHSLSLSTHSPSLSVFLHLPLSFSLKLFCPSISVLQFSALNWMNTCLFTPVPLTIICDDMSELFTPFKTSSQNITPLSHSLHSYQFGVTIRRQVENKKVVGLKCIYYHH